jgi:hypothetical protein
LETLALFRFACLEALVSELKFMLDVDVKWQTSFQMPGNSFIMIKGLSKKGVAIYVSIWSLFSRAEKHRKHDHNASRKSMK